MADEEGFLDEEVAPGGDVEVGQKTGFLPALVIKILKWAIAGVALIALVVTIVVITMGFMSRGTRPATVPAISEDYRATPPKLEYYNVFEPIRTRTADEVPYTVIARIGLGYDPDNTSLYREIGERNDKLQDLLRSYFTQKTAKEVEAKNEFIVKQDLLIRVNAILANGKVEDVIFYEYNVIPL